MMQEDNTNTKVISQPVSFMMLAIAFPAAIQPCHRWIFADPRPALPMT